MKKWMLITFVWTQVAFGQNLGFNGAGFFENTNEDVIQWLAEWKQPFTIRVPGGSISKFHDPYNNRNGWGMSKSSVENWYNSDGFDEDGQGKDKWLKKVNDQSDRSYMDELIKLQKQFPEMQVLYVLNVLNSSPDANMAAIRYLLKNDVNIVGVEAGNEVFGKYNAFEEYIKDFEPIFNQLEKEFPKIKKGLVAGANLNRKELIKWNDALAGYMGKYDAVIIHYYYTSRELAEAYEMIPEKLVYTPGKYNISLDQAFKSAFTEMMRTKLIETGLDYAEAKFKGKAIWITEWNTKPSDMLNNTIVNGAWQFEQMVKLRNRIEYFTVHNGVGPDKYGLISRRNSKFDSEKSPMIKRIGYWSYQLASEVHNGIYLDSNTKNILSNTDNNKNVYYYFTNIGEEYMANINTAGLQITSTTIHYVKGDYAYSAAGYAGYMGKGSTPSYEVQGITVKNYDGKIPANAFGYILYIVK